MQLPSHQRNLYETSSPSFCVGRKLGDVAQALLWRLLQEAPQCPSRVLVDKAAEQHVVITVSLRHINRWRAAQGLGRGKGRPGQAEGYQPLKSGAEVVRMTPHLSCVGVHLFGRWLDQEGAFAPLTARLTEATSAYREQHPDDDFALLHHRPSTLLQRFLALFFAPLLGIERLSEFDSREHPLQTLIGRSYQSTTLSQFLGQLERVGAGAALMAVLLAKPAGQVIYVDGHMIAYWSRRAMHKGKITMLGRIMAGSQAVIAHDNTAQTVFVAYYPPDMHLSQVILAYCEQVSEATGCRLFVIDRAVNSVALAQAFEAHGLGLLCMLDDNEHAGLESFESILVDTLDDGTKVYSGQWQESRQNDPRRFVMVEPTDDKLLVYWATPKVDKVIEKRDWPQLYRERNEIQEAVSIGTDR